MTIIHGVKWIDCSQWRHGSLNNVSNLAKKYYITWCIFLFKYCIGKFGVFLILLLFIVKMNTVSIRKCDVYLFLLQGGQQKIAQFSRVFQGFFYIISRDFPGIFALMFDPPFMSIDHQNNIIPTIILQTDMERTVFL